MNHDEAWRIAARMPAHRAPGGFGEGKAPEKTQQFDHGLKWGLVVVDNCVDMCEEHWKTGKYMVNNR